MDSRRAREELLRNRYVTSDIIFRVPEEASANDSHHQLSVYNVRVNEAGGWLNFFRKVLFADFHGTTEFSINGIHDKGRDYMRAQTSFAGHSPMATPPRQKEPQLPDDLSKIIDRGEYKELGLEESDLSISGSKFFIELHTADPEVVDEQLYEIFDLIDEVCVDSS